MTPEIVCLCGSTRFFPTFQKVNHELTLAGKIVLSIGHLPDGPRDKYGEIIGPTAEQKVTLDALHLQKVKLADRTHILNVDGYIGESTSRELAYAIFLNKKLTFLEPEAGEKFMEDNAHKLGGFMASFVPKI